MKKCPKCGETKALDQFYPSKGTKNGLTCWCKDCICASCRESRKKNAKRIKVYNKNYFIGHRDEISAQQRKYYIEHYEPHPKIKNPEMKSIVKERRLKSRFGISLARYQQLFLEQNGKCAICGKHRDEFKQDFAVDHDHITKEVRGLLCRFCNLALGLLNDDISSAENMINYLKKIPR